MGVSSLQVANPSMGTVSRMPQTTASPQQGADVPFPRLSRQGQILGPTIAGFTMGGLWTPILKPVGGYLRSLRFNITTVVGNLTAATASADAPYNVVQNLFLRDPFGQPIIQASGYSLFLINIYSGQVGALGFGNNVSTLPSWSALSATTGAFTLAMQIPLELDSSAYCSLPSMNASSQPQIQVQTNPSTVVYSAVTGTTPPTLTMALDEPFWMAPVDNPAAAPADVGSSAQWSESRAAAGVGSAQYQRVQLPRVGTYIHTLILVLRDSTGARVDAWPTADLSLWFDGVPVLMESLSTRTDAMFTQFGVTRPTGVIVYTFRNSIQSFVSNGDTYDLLAPTTPATLLEVSGTFGTISNAPATITAVVGELFPLGGIPYTHLAQ
jgi:hypothetical protein